MSLTLDCRDGQHLACAESGVCCCECHELHTREAPLTEQERIDLAHDWALLVWGEPQPNEDDAPIARHAAQPRGLARLMSDPTWRVNLAAAGGCVAGMVTVTVAVLAWTVTR
ncbi:hypothetical protein [Microbacterium allomyrinae]|uniref:Uncharacterized protein n=1 Tax=Microbacterium allomyrinae TaxID=2830666 RepID=A0A9X1LXK7_9MICO|nr:hypothetical protein [Microbacterium allomyrinae]MCC2033892.1 hypothetical protein [Microbacterium allomyrinae]